MTNHHRFKPFNVFYTVSGGYESEYAVFQFEDGSVLIRIDHMDVCSLTRSDEGENGWKVTDGFLSDEELQFLSKEIRMRLTAGGTHG